MTAILRHNPIDVCLTSGEVSVLQGNPSQRTFEASWSGVPVHLHVLTFVKRPNPIAQLPGPTSAHATVAAALDAPPPAQANMLTQPDMIAVATEVEAALVQLIAEPSPQVVPVLACAKVTCRAHIGSPGDEHVTQRIVAEVHIVTPRVPGLVSLSQWLQQRWPQCELNNAAAAAAEPGAANNNGAAAAAGGGGGGATTPAPAPALAPTSHRLAAASSPASGAPGAVSIAAGAPGNLGPGRGQIPGTGPTASRLGASQPIAEGVASRDVAALVAARPGQHAAGAAAMAAANTAATAAMAGTETDGSVGGVATANCIPCLAFCLAPPPLPARETAPLAPGNALGQQRQQQHPPVDPGRAGRKGGTAAAPGAAGTAAGAARAPAAAGVGAAAGSGDAGAGTGTGTVGRRLAGPAGTGLGLGRAPRFPLPPPPPRLPKLPVPEALELLICLAEALRNLHRRGLTHGSLTPKTIQLQLLEADAAAVAVAPAVAAAAAAAAVAVAVGGQPAAVAVQGQEPSSAQGRCPATQPSSSLPQSSSPQSQARTPGHATGQGQEQPTGASAAESSPGGALSAAGDAAVATAAALSGGANSDRVPGAAATAAASSTSTSPAAAAVSPAAATGAEGSQPGADALGTADLAAMEAALANGVQGAGANTEGASGRTPPAAVAYEGGSPFSSKAAAAAAAFTSPAPSPEPVDKGQNAATAAAAADSSPPPPVVPVAPAPSPQRQKSMHSLRRRPLPSAAGGTIRALLPLPAVGPALLQMQTWGRARPVGLPRDHLLWCAPELLSAGGPGWGLPALARRSGNGSASASGGMGLSLGPLDQSIGCRNGNRLRGGNHHHHHNRHFGDGSYGGSMGGGNSRRYRVATSLLMGQDPGAAGSSTHGITPSCDVYALGMLMWYLVSGQLPFQHLATQDQVMRVKEMGTLDEQLPFSTELPSGYVQLARRCWAPLPMQRPTMNVVLSEMRSLRSQLLGLPSQRELGTAEHGYGYGGSSMGEMTGDSRLSFTLSLPLSSRDIGSGEEYSLARPPLELAFGANDAGGGADGGAAGGGGASGGGAADGARPPAPLKASLPAALLTALTAPRRGSAGGGGGGLMDDDDNYSDTDRFTETHVDTGDQTEVSASGTPYSSPTTAGGGRGASGASARLRAVAAAAAAAAATGRSFRLMRVGHRPGSTAGSGRSGGSIPVAMLAATGSRRSHAPGHWGSIGDVGSGPVVGAQLHPPVVAPAPAAAAGGSPASHASIGRVPSALAAAAAVAAGSLKNRCASSSALMGMSGNGTPTPSSAALAALRFSNTPASGGGGGGSCCAGGGATTGSSDGSAGAGGGAAATAGNSSSRQSAMVSAPSASIGCLAVPCGNGSVATSD